MIKIRNVISLCDGVSGGQLALKRNGILYRNYFASEIDKYCVKITKKNFPNTKFIGDISSVDGTKYTDVDLLISGTPCQGFSNASAKKLNFDDPRSKLFFEFARILGEVKPIYFLLENVKMKKEWTQIISQTISDIVGYPVEPYLVNSAVVSGQNRWRCYWTNLPFDNQIEDRGILFGDILVDTEEDMLRPCEPRQIKNQSLCKHVANATDIRSNESTKRVYSPDGKCPTVTTMQGGHREPKVLCGAYRGRYNPDGSTSQRLEIRQDGKTSTLTTVQKDNVVTKNGMFYRKILPIESERLQTFDDNWSEGVSNSQRFKQMGNAFTVAVIEEILKPMMWE